MSVKQISTNMLRGWIDGLLLQKTVIGPVQHQGHFRFESITSSDQLALDYDVTDLPPKKFLLPPREVMMTFRSSGEFQSVMEFHPFVLFGVHPYDMIAINQMDRVFSEKLVDIHYLTRRNACSIVALDPVAVAPHNFSGCMGTATVEKGWDLLLTPLPQDGYLLEIGTEKGNTLLHSIYELPDASLDQLQLREQRWNQNQKSMRRHELKCAPEDLPDLLEQNYDHPLWQEKSSQCLSCGACNIVCPTCYCFDIQDEVDWSLETGVRCRAWDGCLLRDFAEVAGGHNFRKQSAERYRHRFYRKASYLPKRFGEIACVGCGRCISACIPNISNPVEVYNQLVGE